MGPAINCELLPPLHGHAAPGLGLRLLFFMIVGLVSQSDPQFLEFPHPLAVDVEPGLCGWDRCIVPEDVAHVVEQTAHRHQELRLVPLLLQMCIRDRKRLGFSTRILGRK